jgi:hypothetical protein
VGIDVKILRTYSLSKFQPTAAVVIAAAAAAAAKTTAYVHNFCSINRLKLACLAKTQGNHCHFLNKFVN